MQPPARTHSEKCGTCSFLCSGRWHHPVQPRGKVTHLAAPGFGLELQLSIPGVSEVCWAACQVEHIASPEQVRSHVTSGLAGLDDFFLAAGLCQLLSSVERGRDGAASSRGSAFSLVLNKGAEQLLAVRHVYCEECWSLLYLKIRGAHLSCVSGCSLKSACCK